MESIISKENTWALWAILTSIAAVSIHLEQTYKWASRVTGCIIGLVIAMLLSNFKIIPLDAPVYDHVWGYVVPLAIPLLLYQVNIRRIWKESGRILGIFLLSSLGTVIGTVLAHVLLQNHITELYKISAMMAGSYTGGSVNFAALSVAFETAKDVSSAAVVADNLLMAIYFFVLLTIPVSNFFLNKFSHPHIEEVEKLGTSEQGKTLAANFWGAKEISLKDIAFAVSSAFVIVAVSSYLAQVCNAKVAKGSIGNDLIRGLLGNKYLLITTITMILATVYPHFFSNIKGAQEIGTFLIYIFFVVIGVPASITLIIEKSPLLLLFCAIIVFCNMIWTFAFGYLFKFQLEEVILASNANIGGPTTAAAMAIAKGWDKLIGPILLVGTLGYVIGNYFGVLLGSFLQKM